MPLRPPLVLGLALALGAPLTWLGGPAAAAPVLARPYDFDGDGLVDLAVGAPFLTDGTSAEGGVAVLTASRSGLATSAQVLTPDSPGVAGASDGEDQFGDALASADFDGDGYADLAVSLPVAYRTHEGAGSITVLYGSARGLTGARSVELLQPGGPELDTGFGSALAAGDFDGDGRAELAAGSVHGSSGTVTLFLGRASGLAQSRSSAVQAPGGADEGAFGSTLAVGDLDEDGRTDLAVGSAGADVAACYGTTAGLGACVVLTSGTRSSGGTTLAVGNVSGTSRPEVVVGTPDGDAKARGSVVTLSLSGPRGSTTVRRTTLTQDSHGVRGTGEPGDAFGSDVALGDLDADGYADLVVGAPGEDRDAGRVTVIYGGRDGYRTSGGRIYDQDTKGVPGRAEKKDAFGASVSLRDHDGDGRPDLVVGAPGENGGDGAVTVLRGAGDALTTTGARTQTLDGLGHPASRHGGFGDPLGR